MKLSELYIQYYRGYVGIDDNRIQPLPEMADTAVHSMVAYALGIEDRVNGKFCGPVPHAIEDRVQARLVLPTSPGDIRLNLPHA
jgi:hypothetical protein